MTTGLGGLGRLRRVETRSISPENFDGAPGGGGRATEGTGASCAQDLGQGWKISPSVVVAAGETFPLATIDGPGRITHLWITTHVDNWRALVLRAYWDGADEPAVEVPYGDFFCSGWGRFAQVNSQPIAANPNGGFNSYWPMPFRSGARLTIENTSDVPVTVYYQVTYELGEDHAERRLPARAVAPQQPARVARPAHDPGGHRGSGALRRHLPGLGRQLHRVVGRGRDQVLPGRRRRLPDDLRHRDRGLLRRRLELRRARSGVRRVLHPVPRHAPGDPPGRSLRRAAAVRSLPVPRAGSDPLLRPPRRHHPGARLAESAPLPAAPGRHLLDGVLLPGPPGRPSAGAADGRRDGDPAGGLQALPRRGRLRRRVPAARRPLPRRLRRSWPARSP